MTNLNIKRNLCRKSGKISGARLWTMRDPPDPMKADKNPDSFTLLWGYGSGLRLTRSRFDPTEKKTDPNY